MGRERRRERQDAPPYLNLMLSGSSSGRGRHSNDAHLLASALSEPHLVAPLRSGHNAELLHLVRPEVPWPHSKAPGALTMVSQRFLGRVTMAQGKYCFPVPCLY